MAELIYIDTNVYLDYWEARIDKMRPLGEFAYNVIKRAIDCEFIVIVSDIVFKELENHLDKQSIESIFKDLRHYNKLESVESLVEELEKAKTLAAQYNSSCNDVAHALVAKRAGACYLVTRNLKDFENLSYFVKPILPEDI